MIDLYYWTTPNGHKITIFLEEAGLRYRIVPVNISKGDQFKPEFLAISPNNRMPAIVDHTARRRRADIGVRIRRDPRVPRREDRTVSADGFRGRNAVLEWLFWQMGGLGPMAGQNHHFAHYAPEKIPYAIERYVKETNRLYGVLNSGLPTGSSWRDATRSPTWRSIPGSFPRNGRARTWRSFPTSSAGSRPCATAPR